MHVMSKLVEVELTTLESDGVFPCPKCNKTIDPGDEESNETYRIIHADIKREDDKKCLEFLIIQCACGQQIKLKGLHVCAEVV